MNDYEIAVEEAKTQLGYTSNECIEEWYFVIMRAKELLSSYLDDEDEWPGLYKIYLKSEHWAGLRKKVLESDNFQCHFCKKKATQVHHLSYLKLYEPGEIGDLIPICSKCHKSVHGLGKMEI